MVERSQKEFERMFSIVDLWVNALAENHVAQELDRSILRSVLEACGANFEIDEAKVEKLSRIHYSSNIRRRVVAEIWGEKYDNFVAWTKEYVKAMSDVEETVPALESGKKHIGFAGLLEEMTAYAATDEESLSSVDFVTRMTARAWNGYMRYQLGRSEKAVRMHIIVPEYNIVVYEFVGQEGDTRTGEMPFAPSAFPPQFAKEAWQQIKSWRQ